MDVTHCFRISRSFVGNECIETPGGIFPSYPERHLGTPHLFTMLIDAGLIKALKSSNTCVIKTVHAPVLLGSFYLSAQSI
uniref:Uncharacterized protein n=1 Tax=Lepeophtheirus salmonis TaxID=72036 RepID=A0A0K2UKP8_LEPSM